MPSLFANAPVTQEQRAAHDVHRPATVGVVLLALGVYAYLLTDLWALLHLPPPSALLRWAPWVSLRRSGAVDAVIDLSFSDRRLYGTSAVAVMLGCTAVAFVGGYFAPLSQKRRWHLALGAAALALI